MSKPVYHIAIAIVRRQRQYLVTRRSPDSHLGGLWEFPGGKCLPDEPATQAALRELREECAVTATTEHCLPTIQHDYGDRIVNITPVICRWQAGSGQALAADLCQWVSLDELRALPMPTANQRILGALTRDRSGRPPCRPSNNRNDTMP
ncbi:MAG: (deoxy)nucleoside triphosphate pyrophosphohydrolase [Planctomycetota bacterium]